MVATVVVSSGVRVRELCILQKRRTNVKKPYTLDPESLDPVRCHDCGDIAEVHLVAMQADGETGYVDSASFCIKCFEARLAMEMTDGTIH
jgi:hypothetical protein